MAILAAVFLGGIVLWLIGNAMENNRRANDARDFRQWQEEYDARKKWLASIDYPGKKR